MNDLVGKFKKKIIGKLHYSLNNDIKNTILVAGVGRSGTTWLSNIINYNNAYRDMFEPFHNKKVSIYRPIRNKLYLRRNETHQEILDISHKILSGKIRNSWSDSQNKKLISSQRIIKDIRINLILGWIKKNYPELPIVFIIRNPFAVAMSKVKLKWDFDLDDYLSQNNLVEDFLIDKINSISKIQTPFERFMVQWCIENIIPLTQLLVGEAHIVFYEDICLEPELELRKLFSYLKKEFNPDVLKSINKPSSVSRIDSPILTNTNLINSWQKYCSEKKYLSGRIILKMFSLQKIYDEQSTPSNEAITRFYNN